MKARPLPAVFACLLLAAAARAGCREEGVDLSEQFIDPPERRQCRIGSCHVFGSIGAIETALYRQYGVKLRLSEAHMFIARTVNSPDFYATFQGEAGKAAAGAKIDPQKIGVDEGNFNSANLSYALAKGVATDRTAPYAEMTERYYAYRRNLTSYLRSSAHRPWVQPRGPVERTAAWLQGVDPGSSQEIVDFQMENPVPTARLIGTPDDTTVWDLEAKIRLESEVVREALEGFGLAPGNGEFPIKEDPNKIDAARCAKLGEPRRERLLGLLCSGLPAAVGMRLQGLQAWGAEASADHAEHAFMIYGFRPSAEGRFFIVRNSWGKERNHEVREDELCRVETIDAVRSRKDIAGKEARSVPGAGEELKLLASEGVEVVRKARAARGGKSLVQYLRDLREREERRALPSSANWTPPKPLDGPADKPRPRRERPDRMSD